VYKQGLSDTWITNLVLSRENRWQMNLPLHLKIRVKSAGWSLTTPYGARPGIGRCYHIRRRSAPVRYVTTQEKNLKNRPVLGRLSNSPVMCKSLKSYDVSFICDHNINNDCSGEYKIIKNEVYRFWCESIFILLIIISPNIQYRTIQQLYISIKSNYYFTACYAWLVVKIYWVYL